MNTDNKLITYQIRFERGDYYEVEASSASAAYRELIKFHPETIGWDLLDITEKEPT